MSKPKTKQELAELFFEYLEKEHGTGLDQIQDIVEQKISIPLGLFGVESLSGFEIIVKFMREDLKLAVSKISELTKRSESTIRVVYSRVRAKHADVFDHDLVKASKYSIPVERFAARQLSVLETIVVFLREKGLGISEIGKVLHRDPRTIWTVNKRASSKNE